ncbi:MAG: ATP-binding protein [Candidatus Liptonbacteria bacterium]|nr:ATP-binding protein [Candidatus Liptonbacteria bacterium]
MQEKFLILICGLPGAGKTVRARLLEKELSSYILIDQNEIRRRRGIKRMPKSQDATLREIDVLAAKYLRLGKGVIIDSVNRYLFRRHQLYGVASGCGKRALVLEVVCSEKIAKERMRRRTKGDALLSDPADIAVYDRLKKLWEDVSIDFKYPGEDHVGYIQFDSEKQKLKKIIMRKGMASFVKKVENILKRTP